MEVPQNTNRRVSSLESTLLIGNFQLLYKDKLIGNAHEINYQPIVHLIRFMYVDTQFFGDVAYLLDYWSSAPSVNWPAQ